MMAYVTKLLKLLKGWKDTHFSILVISIKAKGYGMRRGRQKLSTNSADFYFFESSKENICKKINI